MKNTNKNKLLATAIISCFIFGVIVAPSPTYAQDNALVQVNNSYVPLAPLPCINGGTVNCGTNGAPVNSVDFQTYVQYTVNLLIALAAVAAVFMMVWGGFEYMTTSAVSGKSEGLKKVRNALGGLALVLCSFLIAKTINPAFVQVPTGLVPNLGLTSKDTSSAWLNTVQSEMDQADANFASTQQTIANATAAASALQNQLNDAQSAQDAACSYGSPDYDATACMIAEFNTNTIQTQLDTLESNTTLTAAKGAMDSAVLTQCGTTGNNDCYAKALTNIDSAVTQASGQLQPDDLQTLQNYAAYSKAIVGLDSAKSYFDSGGANLMDTTAAIDAAVLRDKTTVTDPILYQQVVTQAQALKKQMGVH